MTTPADLTAERIRAAGHRRTYPARSFIFHEGDDSGGVLLIDQGLARIDRTSPSGRIVLLDLASEGRVLGELGVIDDSPRSATISTITDTVTHHVPAATFRQMLSEDSELQGAVLRSVVDPRRTPSHRNPPAATGRDRTGPRPVQGPARRIGRPQVADQSGGARPVVGAVA